MFPLLRSKTLNTGLTGTRKESSRTLHKKWPSRTYNKMKDYTRPAFCCLCSDARIEQTNHIPGSTNCAVHKAIPGNESPAGKHAQMQKLQMSEVKHSKGRITEHGLMTALARPQCDCLPATSFVP